MTTRHYSSTAIATTLSLDVNDTQTTITVGGTTGFPAADFIIAVDPEQSTQELMLVTGVSGDTLTVTRGYDSTAAVSHSTGAAVWHTHAAIDFRDSRTHEGDSSGVHGVTGDVVGTSDTQTLSNKDLTDSSNTFPSTLATFAGLEVVQNALTTHEADTTTHGTTGDIVGTVDVQSLTNKDLTDATNTFPSTLATSAALTTHEADTTTHGTTGDIVGTSDIQTLTNKDLRGTNKFPYFYARIEKVGVGQTVGSTGSAVQLSFGTSAQSQPSGFADAGNNRLVIPGAGMYVISAQVAWDPNGTGFRLVQVRNGSDVIFGSSVPGVSFGAEQPQAASSIIYCSSGDLITVWVAQNSGSSLVTSGTAYGGTYLSAAYVGS